MPPPAKPPARPPLTRDPDFQRLWFVGLVVFSVRWLEMLAVGVFVYQRTGSPFLVAMMTMLRLLPMGLFGAWLGAAVERLERRTSLIAVVASMLASSFVIAVLAYNGRLEVWHLAVASFWNGLGWATDNPVRRMMIGEVVGPDRMGRAMSIDAGSNNASRMLGPTVGGVLLASVGIDGVFTLSVILYVFALFAATAVRYRNTSAMRPAGSVLARMAEGLALVRRDRKLVGTLIITVIYNVFGWPFTSMIPVIGKDNLHLGPEGVGLMASLDGIGAFAGAVLMALYVGPRLYAHAYVGGVIAYLLGLIAFSLTSDPTTAGITLVLTGFGSSGFSIMQATLVYLAAPPEMRSRVLGVLSVCIGIGPIGFVHLGLLADALGAQTASIITGAEGLLAMALTWRWWREIYR